MTNSANGNCCTPRVAVAPSLRRHSDLFQSFFGEPFAFAQHPFERTATGRPSMDAYETDQAYTIELEVPGYTMEQIEITHLGDTLTVKGSQDESAEQTERASIRRERRTGAFTRTVRFAGEVDFGKAEATLAHGVLTITLPKPEKAAPRKIAVKGA